MEKEKEREERKNTDFRERVSNFSLDFPTIGPLVFGEARSKVALRDKSYAWAPVLGSFDKLRKVGVFSYLVYFRFKSFVNGLVDMRPLVAVWSIPKLGNEVLEIWDCFTQSRD